MSNLKSSKTIGLNPLEQYLSATKEIVRTEEQEIILSPIQEEALNIKTAIPAKKTEAKLNPSISKSSKERITLHISSELLEKMKNAVYYEPGLTLAGLAEEALAIALEKLEKKRGESYPERKIVKLRPGRPLK
jgi:uncharacterized protein (DUF4415 family)